MAVRFTSVTIGIPVSDLEAASAWYAQVLGKAHDLEPAPGIREFEVAGTWVQLDERQPLPGNWTLRIGVADLAAERRRLSELGIQVGPVTTVPGLISLFDYQDPDGNQLSAYQLAG